MSNLNFIDKVLDQPDAVELVEHELSDALRKQGVVPSLYPRLTEKSMEQIRQGFKAAMLEDNPVTNAVKYMISVWDEVTPGWRETPDHVKKKFIEAEQALETLVKGER